MAPSVQAEIPPLVLQVLVAGGALRILHFMLLQLVCARRLSSTMHGPHTYRNTAEVVCRLSTIFRARLCVGRRVGVNPNKVKGRMARAQLTLGA